MIRCRIPRDVEPYGIAIPVFPCAHRKRECLRRAGARAFSVGKSENDQVVKDGGSRRWPIRQCRQIPLDILSQIFSSATTKLRIQPTRCRHDRKELAIGRSMNDPRLRSIRPIGNTSIHASGSQRVGSSVFERIKGPQFVSGGRVEGTDPQMVGRDIHHPINDNGGAFTRLIRFAR